MTLYCSICGIPEIQRKMGTPVKSVRHPKSARQDTTEIICSSCCYILSSKPTRRGGWWDMTKATLVELLTGSTMVRTK